MLFLARASFQSRCCWIRLVPAWKYFHLRLELFCFCFFLCNKSQRSGTKYVTSSYETLAGHWHTLVSGVTLGTPPPARTHARAHTLSHTLCDHTTPLTRRTRARAHTPHTHTHTTTHRTTPHSHAHAPAHTFTHAHTHRTRALAHARRMHWHKHVRCSWSFKTGRLAHVTYLCLRRMHTRLLSLSLSLYLSLSLSSPRPLPESETKLNKRSI